MDVASKKRKHAEILSLDYKNLLMQWFCRSKSDTVFETMIEQHPYILTKECTWNGDDLIGRYHGKVDGEELHFIHLAASFGMPARVGMLISASKDCAAARLKAADGRLPLHFAVSSGNYDCTLLLLETYPDAIHVACLLGKTPVHYAIEHKSACCLQLLLEKDSSVCEKRYTYPGPMEKQRFLIYHQTPHRLCPDPLVSRPQTFWSSEKNHWLPLHFAVKLEAVTCVKFLLDAYSDAARVKIRSDLVIQLPIHMAAEHSSTSCLNALLEVNVDEASVTDSRGMVPSGKLHASVTDSTGMVPSGTLHASVTDSRGMLPLHYAVLHGRVEAVRDLLKSWKKGASIETEDGNLPLHLLFEDIEDLFVETRRDLVPISCMLLDAYKDGAKHTNKRGRLPIHGLARSWEQWPLVGRFQILGKMLEAYPHLCFVSPPDGDSMFDMILKRGDEDILSSSLISNMLYMSDFTTLFESK